LQSSSYRSRRGPRPKTPEPFDPTKLLTLAIAIAATADEASHRTAINRAYYAAFLLARSSVGLDSNTSSGVHMDVIDRLLPKNLASKLDSLFRLRKVADYETVPRRSEHYDWTGNWERARRLAEIIVEELQRRA
jgi:hypothetical protein